MKADIIIDQETQKVKLILEASREANREAFRQWLMQFECHEDVKHAEMNKMSYF